ncbi:hypothetical protein Pelo_15027 [Pelomyxa schiedti]|nr:hypothetical protein Pelo_15027 [Pelomyxa schiedti]
MCGSSVGGRVAWLNPSLQSLSCGGSYYVYWAFNLLLCPARFSCQEGIGASSSILSISQPSSLDCYPITYCTDKRKGPCSFGLSMGAAELEGRCQGVLSRHIPNDQRIAVAGDQFSFLIRFHRGMQHGTVRVFRNLKPLVTFERLVTRLPIFPTVQMCCREVRYQFVSNPQLPPLLSLFG